MSMKDDATKYNVYGYLKFIPIFILVFSSLAFLQNVDLGQQTTANVESKSIYQPKLLPRNILSKRFNEKQKQLTLEMVNEDKPPSSLSASTSDQADEALLWRSSREKIKILFYTPFFGNKPWGYFDPVKAYDKDCGCSLDGCDILYNNSNYSSADVVFFHGRDMPKLDQLEKLSKKRMTNQLWVYFIRENPYNSAPVSHIEHLFNLSVSYRYSSNFPFPYNYYVKKTAEEMREYKHVNYAAGKSKQIAWMVSHCGTGRDHLARLFQFGGLHLEVGGSCKRQYHKKIPCSDQACHKELKKYKFYFSAENNLCNNYITEKYWRNPFEMDAVAITLGGSNYSDPQLAIPGSFINALDFHSPKDLIDYIKKVDSNDTLYNEYFKWKKQFKLFKEEHVGCSTFLCDMCSRLKKGIKLKSSKLSDDINSAKECNKQQAYFRDWLKHRPLSFEKNITSIKKN